MSYIPLKFIRRQSNNKEDYMLQDANKIAETPIEELLRLTRDIHSVLCSPEDEEKRESKKQYSKELFRIMSDGKAWSIFQVAEALAERGYDVKPANVGQVLANLTVQGRMERVVRNIYRVPVKEEANELFQQNKEVSRG